MIFSNHHNNWSKTQFLLEKGLDVEDLRRKVIADNIANADVPHFKRTEVSYEAQLRRALDSKEYVAKNEVPSKMSHSRHIPFFRELDYKNVGAKSHVDYLSSMRNDGNNVDLEHEISASVKNQLRYQALATVMNHNFKTMNMVIRASA